MTKTIEDMNIDLRKGDCLDIMDRLIEEGVKVDLTVTSPPYDNLRTYKGSLQWNEDIWKQILQKLYAITKDGGVVVWVVGDATIKGSETGTSFKQALYAIECGFNLHDTMVWNKSNSFNFGSNNCYKQEFEYMFVFSKGRPNALNLIKDIPSLNKGIVMKGGRRHSDGSRDVTPNFKCADFKKRGNIWNISVGANKTKHPAVFPEKLANDHIVSWSNEGDVVFDPFMGSGTTGKMAILNNRNFIGVEKVEEYFEIAKERIENER